MNDNFKKVLNTNFDDNITPNYLSDVEKLRYKDSVIRLLEMQTLLVKSVMIADAAEIPLGLIKGLEDVIEKFIELKNLLNEANTPKPNYNANNVFNRIQSEHDNFFEPSSSNRTMMIINMISNYESSYEKNISSKLNAFEDELKNKNKRVDEILLKLENPSAEKVLSDYSTEYGKEEINNNKKSLRWLITGIATTFVFVILLLISIFYEWFPLKLSLESVTNGVAKSSEIINVPIFVTKILLISLVIYFIVFCFKQYSIYKHLAVINQQKKNAFNSYTLFAAAVGEKDVEAKRALLMSLAKTIHESVNTGFLSSKQSEPPSIQNVDLGKLFSGNLGKID